MTKYLLFILLALSLYSCSALPQISKDIEEIATDNAVRVEIQKGALKDEANIHLDLNVTNK